jgi:tetratricopeptide (TPR) repeat protein
MATAAPATGGPSEPRKDFFISYNQADRPWAEWIAWQLDEAGYSTVLQAWDFRPGGNWVLAMQRATAEADRTLAVLSPEFLAAAHTQPEWAAAFAQDPTGEKGTLVPVRVRMCDIPGMLRTISYIDLVDVRDEDAARDKLLNALRTGRLKPATTPSFPGTTPVRHLLPESARFPGALPRIWNLPRHRNRNFTGREDVLSQLRIALTSGHPATLTQALAGLGGVGKTQLAIEYAYRYASEYHVVWWVRAEEPATLAADYALLAEELDLPEREQPDQSVVVAAVRHWFQQNQGWLLIFDNVPEPPLVVPYLPHAGDGNVLITSRYPAWRAVAHAITVEVLGRDEAVTFLLKRTDQADVVAARALAEGTGDLPLALEQAASYIESTGRSLAGYLRLFESRQQDLLQRGGRISTDYPATVATTWELAFQEVSTTSPVGAALMQLCAFLAPDNITRVVLSSGADHLPQPLADAFADALVFDEAVEAVLRYSLIGASDGVLSMHRLVQAVVRDRLRANKRRAWAQAAVQLVNASFPSVEVQTWPICAQLLPHALAATAHADTLQIADEAMGRLLNQVGFYLRERAQLTAARDALERSLAIREKVLRPDHPDIAQTLNNLGSLLRDQGDLMGARSKYDRALAIREKVLGPIDPSTAQSLNNLGHLMQLQGDLTGARPHLERALAIREEVLGPDHPTTAISLNTLGFLLHTQANFDRALPYYERALAIREKALGPNHPSTAQSLNNLGLLLQNQGNLSGARPYYERALAIREKMLGPNHIDTATSLNNLGTLLEDFGELADARRYLERALTIWEKVLGPLHKDTLAVRRNLRSFPSITRRDV